MSWRRRWIWGRGEVGWRSFGVRVDSAAGALGIQAGVDILPMQARLVLIAHGRDKLPTACDDANVERWRAQVYCPAAIASEVSNQVHPLMVLFRADHDHLHLFWWGLRARHLLGSKANCTQREGNSDVFHPGDRASSIKHADGAFNRTCRWRSFVRAGSTGIGREWNACAEGEV